MPLLCSKTRSNSLLWKGSGKDPSVSRAIDFWLSHSPRFSRELRSFGSPQPHRLHSSLRWNDLEKSSGQASLFSPPPCLCIVELQASIFHRKGWLQSFEMIPNQVSSCRVFNSYRLGFRINSNRRGSTKEYTCFEDCFSNCSTYLERQLSKWARRR